MNRSEQSENDKKSNENKKNVTIIENKALRTLLASFSAKETKFPQLIRQVKILFTALILAAISKTFPIKKTKVKTKMDEFLEEDLIDTSIPIICVDLARAGMLPTQVCFEILLEIFPERLIRQDHIFINRSVDEKETVIGANLSGAKIGGDKQGAIIVFADPMGATGTSLIEAINFYKKNVEGVAKKFIALNLMITPEYIENVTRSHPELEIFALRKDRGLNSKQYIVPGAGGIGELLNNEGVLSK